MAVSMKWGFVLVGVLLIRARRFGVSIRAPDVGKLQGRRTHVFMRGARNIEFQGALSAPSIPWRLQLMLRKDA